MDTRNYKYYRDIRIWPLAESLDYKQWLENFAEGEEQDIANRILDYFVYFPNAFIDQMLKTVIGKCGYIFNQKRRTWFENDFYNNCWYSFIPGEAPNPTDSGYIFNRKLREVLHISQERILDYKDLWKLLQIEQNQNVILVDDFVGSGSQTYSAWTKNTFNGRTLQEDAIDNHHIVIYAPLVVNYIGYNVIKTYCNDLNLVYIYLLGEEHSLFNKNCPCWEGNSQLYVDATNLILDKSLDLGIPSTRGKETNDVRGFGEQGLALAFEHGMPDACPPFFYWESKNWKPLISKVYSRP